MYFQNFYRNYSSEDTVELVDVDEVLWHLRGEHEVDDGLPDQLEGVAVEALENVDAVVGERELEGQGRVVVLQDSDVVVEVGELGVGIEKEGTEKEWTRDTLSFVSLTAISISGFAGKHAYVDWF